jgi:hypothetical protein
VGRRLDPEELDNHNTKEKLNEKWVMKREVLLLLVAGLVFIALGSVPDNTTYQAQAISTVDYQDSAWLANMKQFSSLLDNDFKSISAVSNSGDLNLLTVFGRYLMYDTQRAIYDNDQYEVSQKYQDAQREWKSALQDYNIAGKLMMEAGDEVLNNTDGTASENQYTVYLYSGNYHANRSYSLVNAA